MRYTSLAISIIMVIFLVSCGGKTTVRDEMIDTAPRDDQRTTQQPVEPPIEDPAPNEDPIEDEKPEPRPAPGTQNGDQKPEQASVFPERGPENTRNSADRDNYMNTEIVYPNSETADIMSLPSSGSKTSNRTLTTDDTPENVIGWYQNKFGNTASISPSSYGTNISITDKKTGYKSLVIVQKAGSQGKTLITITVSDA